jgi:hypothetical protein
MDDYEIRDVEGRRQQPRLDVQLQVVRETTRANSLIGVTGIPEDWPGHPELKITLRLEVRILNAGSTMVRYLEVKLDLPKPLSSEWSTRRTNEGEMPETSDFSTYETRSFENVVPTYRSYGFGTNEPYQPPYHYPVLPGMTYVLGGISVTDNALVTDWGESAIRWMAAGDIVPMRQGEVLIKDLLSGAIDASELTS